MSYLLDKKIKRKKILATFFIVLVFLFLFYFRNGLWRGLSHVSSVVFRPVLVLGNNISDKFSGITYFLHSKRALMLDNQNLKRELDTIGARVTNYDAVLDENTKIKEIMGRAGENKMILAGILAKPNQSPYDTLVLDIGAEDGILVGQRVFAMGDIPIGRIDEVYKNSSKVVLFSSNGEKTEVTVAGNDIFIQAVGRGGGNFEINLVNDFVLTEGTNVVLRGINPYILGTVKKIISDPRDSFQKALLVSPVNIQEIKFVQVEK